MSTSNPLANTDKAAHEIPPSQRVLLLHGPRQPYHVTHDYAVPQLHHDREILVRTAVIGLNPIDWKSPDFNFAIPELPYIAGRECAGEVVQLKTRAETSSVHGLSEASEADGLLSPEVPSAAEDAEADVVVDVTDNVASTTISSNDTAIPAVEPIIHTFLTNDASAAKRVSVVDAVEVDDKTDVPLGRSPSTSTSGRITTGDRVLAISTDYRDLRKGAYQEYVVVWDYNTVRLPPHVSCEAGATMGVAFVAAVLALGVNLGVDFSSVAGGPDLLSIVRRLPPAALAADIRDECLRGIGASDKDQDHDRARAGDWLAIWGASSTSAHMAIQLARLAGLRVAAVVDTAKHGWRLARKDGDKEDEETDKGWWQPDWVVDSHDPARAVAVLRANLGSRLRFGFDTRGRDTATWLLQALAGGDPAAASNKKATASTSNSASGRTTPRSSPPSPPATPRGDNGVVAPISDMADTDDLPVEQAPAPKSHLVGLTGLPKGTPPPHAVFHSVPIKLFHEVPAVGEALSSWLERLLASKKLVPPVVAGVEDGLERVNAGLDRLRAGEISGGRLVVRLEGRT
ncbi:uncharacterized protein SPSK_06171 [Sporothrix schenckii 1099-18]|uniref:Alcohol dehydrogenase-like N-terminal domain-containing protein n=1 Tax=Sporothrix schenckii 1099-18 TaxID=1397361 RepID=A0A0F2MLQ9_SPOSC|nr:uncharacterized protein SPSK_06171 [Sporothrix schenckii 1099-18]KJR89785.1 hypothetical protein SPSK_06171 [Sporothrix schenckii 1099-18]